MDSLQHFADIYSKPRSFAVDAAAADAGDDADGNGDGNEAAEAVGTQEAEEGGAARAEDDEAAAEADVQPSQGDNDVSDNAVQDQQSPNLSRFPVNYPGEAASSPSVPSDDYYVQRQPLPKFNPFGLLSQGIGGQATLGSLPSFGSYPSASPGARHSSYYL